MKSKAVEIAQTPLEKAADKTPDVKGHFCKGLGAVKGSERTKFLVPDTRQLTGSIDIDSATRDIYPEDNRWDYVVEYNTETFFIEVHPCSTSDVGTIIKKLTWLKGWLKEKAPRIDALKSKNQPYHWIATSGVGILPNSNYAKKLAQNKIVLARHWDYSKITKKP